MLYLSCDQGKSAYSIADSVKKSFKKNCIAATIQAKKSIVLIKQNTEEERNKISSFFKSEIIQRALCINNYIFSEEFNFENDLLLNEEEGDCLENILNSNSMTFFGEKSNKNKKEHQRLPIYQQSKA
ncbi:MAG: hypothetical protein QM652_13540 [Legionella sp.]|uniref:hypothetical protein n=1 Tax=Legionella sp. TaxID=459 RepID=UPI0039E2A5E4